MEQFQAGETASSLYRSTWPLCLPLEEMMYGQTGADNAPCTVHLFGNGVCSSAAKPQVRSLTSALFVIISQPFIQILSLTARTLNISKI